MATEGTVQIINQIAASKLDFLVTWADQCCAEPSAGSHPVKDLAFGQSSPLRFMRNSFQGCDGQQGNFTVEVRNNGASLGSVRFNMDSHGNLSITFPVPSNNQFRFTLGTSSSNVSSCVFYV